MGFKHGLQIGNGYSTYYIAELFKHNRYRGMRYSKTNNTLVLISDHVKSPYEDRWIGGVFHYNGMGLTGNQDINFMQNKTLAQSLENNTEVFLFEIFEESQEKYIFMGRVELCDNPYIDMQYDEKNNLRKVWVFPLMPIELNANIPIVKQSKLEKAENSSHKLKEIKKLNDNELHSRAETNGRKKSGSRRAVVNHYQRNVYISEYVKRRAKGFCELCEKPAPFKNGRGEPFLESHHIVWLAKGGEDSIYNTVALCPNCHRKMHFAPTEEEIKKLKNIRKELMI